jgi:hypothetical protein
MRPRSNMERCLQCNSTLAKQETSCWACGAAVPEKNPKKTLDARFRLAINILFIIFGAFTVVSIFMPTGMLTKCIAGMVILALVRSSAQNMADTKKG